MMTLLDLAKISSAVYPNPPAEVEGWSRGAYRLGSAGGLWDDLQAAIYNKQDGGTAVAFRGTNLSMSQILGSVQDLMADLELGLGRNTNAFGVAGDFMRQVAGRPEVVVCGHSLGGAVAQIIGNRQRLRIATFNAPGVGVWSSKNLGSTDPLMFLVRTAGMVSSAAAHPIQAAQDLGAAFHHVRGVNVRLDGDVVSKIGLHYGTLTTIKGPANGGAMEQHKMDSVVASLTKSPELANRDITTFN